MRGEHPQRWDIDWLVDGPFEVNSASEAEDSSERPMPQDPHWY